MLKRHTFSMSLALAALLAFAGPAFADEVINGSTGPGSVYRLIRPTNWNGILLLYAHGFVSKDIPVGISRTTKLVISLPQPRGFAVAVSSFDENGWVVKDGTQRTHQLLGLFTSKFGNPARVYVGGGSMGGLIAIQMIETWPDGLRRRAPGMRGGQRQRAPLRLLPERACALRPLLSRCPPGDRGRCPGRDRRDPGHLQPGLAAMTANPSGALAIASIAQTPVPFAQFPGAPRSRSRPRSAEPRAIRKSSRSPKVTRTSTTRRRSTREPFRRRRSRSSTRTSSDSRARPTRRTRWITTTRRQAISGSRRSRFRRSAIRLSPVSTAPSTARRSRPWAMAIGSSSARSRERGSGYGHCTFTPDELMQAFLDLVLWGEFGVKPTP